MNFASDNTGGIAPEIMAAIAATNHGNASSYGADALTQKLEAHLAALFETELKVFPVVTGTAANALALAMLTPPWGAIYCHADAHIHNDECGAPEFFTLGAKLLPLPGSQGRLVPETLAAALKHAGNGRLNQVQPRVLSLTNATEAGTVYAPDRIAELSAVAHRHGLHVHLDGARFANAATACAGSPAELTWRAGVDVVALGATKNGALAAEAVVVFRPELAREFDYRRKRGGHLLSKMRFVSAQLLAYFTDDLWLRNAAHANAMARRLAEGLAALPGAEILHPVEANAVFVRLPESVAVGLRARGAVYYDWPAAGPGAVRLVTAFDTPAAAVDRFLAAAQALAEGEARRKEHGAA